MKKATRSHNTLSTQKYNLRTSMNDWPSDIVHALNLETGHVDGHYDPLRGWQIVALHRGRTLYIDCDEKSGVVRVI
jgi:hypothetical protein